MTACVLAKPSHFSYASRVRECAASDARPDPKIKANGRGIFIHRGRDKFVDPEAWQLQAVKWLRPTARTVGSKESELLRSSQKVSAYFVNQLLSQRDSSTYASRERSLWKQLAERSWPRWRRSES